MGFVVRLFKRVWLEMTLTWTRPVGLVALIAIGVLSGAWPAFGDASEFAIIALVVFMAPREAKLAREAHRKRGTPWPSRRSLNIRGGIFGVLTLLCLGGALFAFDAGSSDGTSTLLTLAGVFASLAWLYLFRLKNPPDVDPAVGVMRDAESETAASPAEDAPPIA